MLTHARGERFSKLDQARRVLEQVGHDESDLDERWTSAARAAAALFGGNAPSPSPLPRSRSVA